MKLTMRRTICITACICLGGTVKAQDTLKTVQLDEVVFTGTKTEIPVEKCGKSIYKITSEEIIRSGARSVSDVLNQVPGVQMDGNFGPLGTNIGYFIRGASSKRTLILIDGVPFNDPSGIDQTYDLRLLDIDQVASIEILRGGLSSLYGTGAAAGVINISLKKPMDKPIEGNLGMEYGSFKSVKTRANIAGKWNKFSYLMNGGTSYSKGFSSATDANNNGDFDEDGFRGHNLLSKIGYEFSDRYSVTWTGAYDEFDSDYDQGAFIDGDHTTSYNQFRLGLSQFYKWNTGNLRSELFFNQLERVFNSPDFFDPTARFIDEYDGKNIQAEVYLDQNLGDQFKLIGGLNYQFLEYGQPSLNERNFRLIDPYLTFIYDRNRLNLQVGGRLNHHSEYGANFVWNVNPSYLISWKDNQLKLFGSYATSFISPSLFQLFGPFGANVNLIPETSIFYEGGFSILGNDWQFDAVYFRRSDKDLIVYGGSGYENAAEETNTQGVELTMNVDVTSKINLSGNYGYLNLIDGAELFRVPRHKYGISMIYTLTDPMTLKLSYLHTGDRLQPYFNPNTFLTDVIETDAFDLIDVNITYQMEKMTFSGSINNVFNESYVAVYGFNAVKRNYLLSVTYRFH